MVTLIQDKLTTRREILKNWDLTAIESRLRKYQSQDFDVETSIKEYREWILLLSLVGKITSL